MRAYRSVNPAILVRVPAGKQRILDIGCGDGSLGRALKQRSHCTVVGVTQSPDEASSATKTLDKVLLADVETTQLSSLEDFDVIVCSHVLEHLRDPGALLSRLRPSLRSSGVLLVALPNVLYWRQRVQFLLGRFRYSAGGLMDESHLRFFDWHTARELVRNAGYSIEEAVTDGGFPASRYLGPIGPILDRLALASLPGVFGTQFVIVARTG